MESCNSDIATRSTAQNILWIGLLVLLFSACNRGSATPQATEPPALPTATVVASPSSLPPTPLPPTSTPAPLAAKVNGEGITLTEYQAELERFQAASGTNLAPEDEKRVLDDLIDQVLLAQAAEEQGFIVDDAMLQERTRSLVSQTSEASFVDWLAAQGFNEMSFRQALARSIAAAWMRDQVIAAVPKTADQVHARQILLYTPEDAAEILSQLKAGNDFGNLARRYDPLTGGDLGWFPRGYLFDAGLEEAAFNLQPDQFSDVIETLAGFHILQVLERDPQRPLDPEALLTRQSKAITDWMAARRLESQIEILVP